MKKIIILMTVLLSTSILAEVAKVKLEFKITSLFDNSKEIDIKCDLYQTLEWGNAINYMNCNDNENDNKVFIKNFKVSVGYDYNRSTAFIIYPMSTSNSLGEKLFKAFLPQITIENASKLKMFFYEKNPRLLDEDIIVNTSLGAYLLNIGKVSYID